MRLEVDQAAVERLLATPVEAHARIVAEIYADAVRFAPVDTGALRASIRMEIPAPGVGFVSVGTNYWPYQEFGAGPHVIRGDPLAFFWPRIGGVLVTDQVNHPGNPAVAYMRRALFQPRSL